MSAGTAAAQRDHRRNQRVQHQVGAERREQVVGPEESGGGIGRGEARPPEAPDERQVIAGVLADDRRTGDASGRVQSAVSAAKKSSGSRW